MFALVDCNSCYASCEQIFRPDLRNKPVVVLTNNDGCIVTRTKEAKALNIPDLTPYFKIKHELKKHQVNIFSSNYELYGDISNRVMSLLKGYCRAMEVYSIDEAFLDVSGCKDLYDHGISIKQACWKEQRMPVCVGIAPTKTLSKLANHIAKKVERLNGVCVIEDPNPWHKVFSKLSTKKIWGVGSRISKRLEHYAIYTVEDLRQQDPKRLRKDFGVTLERTIRELNGECWIPLEVSPPAKKEIFCSRSFSEKITSEITLNESIANYAVRASEKLRKQNSLTARVHIMLQTSRFNPPYYFNSASMNLLYPTNDSRIIVEAALVLSKQIFKPNYKYAKAGVGLLNLVDETYFQHDFFTKNQTEKSHKAMEVFDSINDRYGSGSLFLGRQGIQRQWSMARAFKSPAYTTRMADIPVIKVY